MIRRSKLLWTAIAIALSILFAIGYDITPASAGIIYNGQYCYEYSGQACLNAWNGGPFVNVYDQKGVTNNNFAIFQVNGDVYGIEFVGGGSWDGYCIGDAYNEENNGYTSLDNCPQGGGGGWGTNFTLIVNPAGSGTFAFKNDHWSAVQNRTDYLCPVNNFSNGKPFILNATAECIFYANNPA